MISGKVYPIGIIANEMRSTIREIVQTLALTALAFLMLQTIAKNYRVEGPSMDPGLIDSQLVIVNRAVYLNINLDRLSGYLPYVEPPDDINFLYLFDSPKRGDIIVFRNPLEKDDPDFVKRVIGLPGERVEIKSGQVLVNRMPINEPYIQYRWWDELSPLTLGPNEFFVLGDNRSRSEDSRHFGVIHASEIIGKVWLRYWPFDQFGGIHEH